ncbi:MAG TPA: TolC family protein, partial [Gemmatimonadales bacterium]|nr:TolC family protein [Gemmatimonadales bacterium]
ILAQLCIVPATLAAQDTTRAVPSDTTAAPARSDTAAALRAAPGVALSLDEAIGQARKNSPAYRQTLNDAGPAKWGVRNAYGQFLPTVTAAGDLGYTGTGQTNIGGGFVQGTSAFLTSGYSLGLNWQLDGRVLSGPGQQKALQRATSEDIAGAGTNLRADITTQYLNTLQASAQVGVARQQVLRNQDFLRLAKARYDVGQATLLDVRQAEVAKGQSDVALLRAEQAENEAKLELLRRMGVEPPVEIEQIALTDSFPVQPPEFKVDDLLSLADEQNPAIRSQRARARAATWGVRAAKSEYLPSLTLRAGWSGFTQQFTDEDLLLGTSLASAQDQAAGCQFDNQVRNALSLGPSVDCFGQAGLNSTGTALSDEVASGIRSSNNVFPFDYTGQPFQASLIVTLPIFTGFSRSLRVSQARALEQDADEAARAQRLQVRSEVKARYLGLQTSYRAIAVQAANREAARDQLRLAQDRYRLGAGTSLEVSDAQNSVQQAEGDYVNAVYDYHKAVAALEAAVGRPLR